MLEVCNGRLEEINEIMEVYAAAREIMRSNGNPNQWGTTHPPYETVLNDINNRLNYVIKEDGVICGSFFFDVMEDPTYMVIEGAWLNDKPYGVIHRIGSNGKASGVLKTALEFAFKNTSNVRIDTHEDNKIMQHLLTKYGFTRCGIIHLANGDPRIAFHREVT